MNPQSDSMDMKIKAGIKNATIKSRMQTTKRWIHWNRENYGLIKCEIWRGETYLKMDGVKHVTQMDVELLTEPRRGVPNPMGEGREKGQRHGDSDYTENNGKEFTMGCSWWDTTVTWKLSRLAKLQMFTMTEIVFLEVLETTSFLTLIGVKILNLIKNPTNGSQQGSGKEEGASITPAIICGDIFLAPDSHFGHVFDVCKQIINFIWIESLRS